MAERDSNGNSGRHRQNTETATETETDKGVDKKMTQIPAETETQRQTKLTDLYIDKAAGVDTDRHTKTHKNREAQTQT